MEIARSMGKRRNKELIDSIGEAVIIFFMSSTIIEILISSNIKESNLSSTIEGFISLYKSLNRDSEITRYINEHEEEVKKKIESTLQIVEINDDYLDKDPYNNVEIQYEVSAIWSMVHQTQHLLNSVQLVEEPLLVVHW